MGRRGNIPVPAKIAKARSEALRQVQSVLSRYDVAEFEAQQHAPEMVKILADFARDPMQPIAFRRDCALDVLNRASGTVAQKAAVSSLDPSSPEGSQVGGMIEAATRTARDLQVLDDYVGLVPYEQWPEDVKLLAGDLGAVWSEEGKALTVDQDGTATHTPVSDPGLDPDGAAEAAFNASLTGA